MRVLFWNTHKNEKINIILKELILENHISIVALAEYTADIDDLISAVHLQGKHLKKYTTIGCDRLKILGTIENVQPGDQSTHASIQIINEKDILCCVHLQSKGYPDHEERRNITINQITNEICALETKLGTENSIIVGDFNVNPFDSACIGARNFHSLPIYETTANKSRRVSGQDFRMFYNPMWNLLGDFNQPYGTFYYNGSTSDNIFWNIYDQVIIRPSLRKRFIDSSLKIVTETQTKYLLDTKGHPQKTISDHLPIIFEISEE